MTDSAALLKRKYMIVKFLIDREFITFFIQTEAQTHVAQEVPIDGFISGRLVWIVSALMTLRSSRPAKSQSEAQRPLWPRAGSRNSAVAQS